MSTSKNSAVSKLWTTVRSPLFTGWCIALFLAAVLETVLTVAPPLSLEEDGIFVTVVYFISEVLSMTIRTLSAMFLFSLICFGTPYVIPCFATAYFLLFFICRLLTTMFFTNFFFDTWWETGKSGIYLGSLLSEDIVSLLLIVGLSFVLFLVLTLFFPERSKENAKRIVSVSQIVLAAVSLLIALLRELFVYTIPYLSDVSKGDSTLGVPDAVYIVFKYLFYTLCALLLYFIGRHFHRKAETFFNHGIR